MRRWLMWALLVGLLVGAVAIAGYTQRTGPTAEDKTLAADLVRKALDDTSAIADLGNRGSAIASVFRGAEEMKISAGEMAVRREVALDLLHKAFQEAVAAEAMAEDPSAAHSIYGAAWELDKETADKWVAEIEDADVRAQFEPSAPTEDTSIGALATHDVAAALEQVEQIEDQLERANGKIELAQRLASAGLSRDTALRLAQQAATLVNRAGTAFDKASLRLSVAQVYSDLGEPDKCVAMLKSAVTAVAAIEDEPGAQAGYYLRVAELADSGPQGFWGYYPGTYGRPTESVSDPALAKEATARAKAAALGIEDPDLRLSYVGQVANRQLRMARYAEKNEKPAILGEALDTVEQVPTDSNQRTQLLSEAAQIARKWDLKLAGELLDQALECSTPASKSFESAMGRASLIANAALAGDKRCWEWAASDAREVRSATWAVGEEQTTGLPDDLARGIAETAVLGATFATGDLQRAKDFVKTQGKLGGYDAAEALWCVSTYVWDPSLSFDLAAKLLDRLQGSEACVRGCIAALSVAPAYAHKLVVADSEAYVRATPLYDKALQVATASTSATDRAVAGAALCAAAAAVDPQRAAKAAALAAEGLKAMDDQELQDTTAGIVCTLVGVGDPKGAAELTDLVGDPQTRSQIRMSTAQAILLDFEKLRGEI